MAMNRRFRRPFIARRPKPNYKWQRVSASFLAQAANVTGTSLVLEPIDYDDTTLSPTGVTVKRIVGEAVITPAGLNVGAYNGAFGINASDFDSAPVSPGVAVDLIEERWLYVVPWSFRILTAVGIAEGYRIRFDTKVQVRCRDTAIRLQFYTNPGIPTTDCIFMASVLLVGDTS